MSVNQTEGHVQAPIVFIALQTNDESRRIIDAIEADNPHAKVNAFPAMVKIDAPGRIVVRRESIEEDWGGPSICVNCNCI